MMRFIKYSKIENHYRPEFIERIRMEGMDKGDWVATEKIHGANFSIWANATRTRIAKRTGLLGDGTGFFNVYQIREELKAKARECWRIMKLSDPKLKAIAIYGELCGGCYPHPKVVPSSRFKKVQQGVWYSPNLEFFVFDIAKIYNAQKDREYIPFWSMKDYAESAGFNVVPIVDYGRFDIVMKIRNDYVSKVPRVFGLPVIKGNIMEGIVIRSDKDKYLRRGERVIIKSKNSKYAEKVHHKPKRILKLTGVRKKIADKMLSFLNLNRYNAVVSKMGDVEPKHFNEIMGKIIQDIHSDIIDDYPKLYMQFQELDKTERKLIHRVLSPEVAVIIREKLLGIKRSVK